MERTKATYSVSAAHVIPPGSQLHPFYLLEQKAPNARRAPLHTIARAWFALMSDAVVVRLRANWQSGSARLVKQLASIWIWLSLKLFATKPKRTAFQRRTTSRLRCNCN